MGGIRDQALAAVDGSPEWRSIQDFYRGRHAERSGRPYLTHITDGLVIMHRIRSTDAAMRAYCVHPLFQTDSELRSSRARIGQITTSVDVVALALEYRNIANQYLSTRGVASVDDIVLSPLREVNDMLVADKVQNYHDFLLNHLSSHPRSQALVQYFDNWLARLGVSEDECSAHRRAIGD